MMKQTEDGILVDEIIADEPASEKSKENYTNKTLKELHKLLETAVLNEDYETAAKIRDEISKR